MNEMGIDPLDAAVFGSAYMLSPTSDPVAQAQHAAHQESGNTTPVHMAVMALAVLFVLVYGLHLFERWRRDDD